MCGVARLLLPMLLLAGCTTTVKPATLHDLAQGERAWIAGALAWQETPLRGWLRLEDERGGKIRLALDQDAFLFALQPGRWRVSEIGGFVVAHDEPWLEARPGQTTYVGSIHPARDDAGNLDAVVRDEQAAVQAALAARYGARAPTLERGLLASALEPLEPVVPGAATVIALRPRASAEPAWSFRLGFGWGYGGYCAWYPSTRCARPAPARRRYRSPPR